MINAHNQMYAWQNFLNHIREAEDLLNNPKVIWYRGVSSVQYSLLPSLFRFSNGLEKEKELFLSYQTHAKKLLTPRGSDWEYLFDMQHHSIPTRLLDWTEVFGVAVFFAVMDDSENDAAFYLLDPIKLNAKSKRSEITVIKDDTTLKYQEFYWQNFPMAPVYPIAVHPLYLNDRVAAQRGKFTIHGNDTVPLEELAEDCTQKVILPLEAKLGAREFLRLSGIDEFSVFPDIVGLAPFLIRRVGLTRKVPSRYSRLVKPKA